MCIRDSSDDRFDFPQSPGVMLRSRKVKLLKLVLVDIISFMFLCGIVAYNISAVRGAVKNIS